jgi:trehalose-6-phosphatase
MKWNNTDMEVNIKWYKTEVNKIGNYFMGDLFGSHIYNNDSIIYHHTKEIISKIDCKYKINFHISRLTRDKKVNKDSAGEIF